MSTIKLRRDTLDTWNNKNPILANGEVGLIIDNNNIIHDLVIGNGDKSFSDLKRFKTQLGNDDIDISVNCLNHNFIINSNTISIDSDGNLKTSGHINYSEGDTEPQKIIGHRWYNTNNDKLYECSKVNDDLAYIEI